MSTLKVNTLDTRSGTDITVTTGKTVVIPAGATLDVAGTQTVSGTQTVTGTVNLSASTLSLPATLPATAGTNITSIPGANITGTIPAAALTAVDTTGLQDDIALLAFKTQANGSLARYNLVDQSVDAFEDASGVDAGSSTNATRNASKYYSGQSVSTPTATGGTITTYGDYTIHTFLTGANYVNDTTQLTDVLVVAGGGGGGSGGGGAGGLLASAALSVAANTYAVTVGAGGAAGGTAAAGTNGDNSVFSSLTAIGGGGGGKNDSQYPDAQGAKIGGSGGGMGASSNPSASQGAPGTAGQGNAGANTGSHAAPYPANGGGGAGTTGFSGGGSTDGNGGTGLENAYRTGSNVFYAGGGAGNYAGGGTGGNGGGGNGSVAGTVNTGGGGGGAAAGGSGIVVVKRLTVNLDNANLTLVSNATTAQAAPTKGDLVFTYTNGSGTAVVGTNITADYSADDGSTWTDFGILPADVQGTTGGHTIVTKNNVTLTSTSGTSMRYRIKTLVQGAALETRIQAVSLGWS